MKSCHDTPYKVGINEMSDSVGECFFFIMRFIIEMGKIRNKIAYLYEIRLFGIFFHNIFDQITNWFIYISPKLWVDGIISSYGSGSFSHRTDPALVCDDQVIPFPMAVIFNPLNIVCKCFFKYVIRIHMDSAFVNDYVNNTDVERWNHKSKLL